MYTRGGINIAMRKIPVFIIPQMSDEEWELITSLSPDEQLQLSGSIGFLVETVDEHQISMDEFIEMMEGVE